MAEETETQRYEKLSQNFLTDKWEKTEFEHN